MKLILILAAAALAACGADGPPLKPRLGVGVSVGSGGISTGASAGVNAGPVTVAVGL